MRIDMRADLSEKEPEGGYKAYKINGYNIHIKLSREEAPLMEYLKPLLEKAKLGG